MKSVLFTIISVLVSTQAHAGSWAYGCVGAQANGNILIFNRDILISVPATLAKGQVPQLRDSDEILRFDADDINSGFQKTMTFTHKWMTSSDVVKFIEKSSTRTLFDSKTVPCSPGRIRDESHEVFKKIFEVELPGATAVETIEMICYENIISACG